MTTRKTIHKFVIPFGEGDQALVVPEGMQVLSVQMQHGAPTMWVLRELGVPLERRWYRWVATGQVFDHKPTFMHLATLQFSEEAMPLVFHLFDVTGV